MSKLVQPPRRFILSFILVILYNAWAVLLLGIVALVVERQLAARIGDLAAGGLTALGLGAVAALYLRSYRQAEVHEQVLLPYPVADVFRFIATDFFSAEGAANIAARRAGTLLVAEQTSPGPLDVGTTGRKVTVRNGRQTTWLYQVLEYDPDCRFATAVHTPGWAGHYQTHYELQPTPAGTQATIHLSLHLTGPRRLLTPFLIPQLRRQLQIQSLSGVLPNRD